MAISRSLEETFTHDPTNSFLAGLSVGRNCAHLHNKGPLSVCLMHIVEPAQRLYTLAGCCMYGCYSPVKKNTSMGKYICTYGIWWLEYEIWGPMHYNIGPITALYKNGALIQLCTRGLKELVVQEDGYTLSFNLKGYSSIFSISPSYSWRAPCGTHWPEHCSM